MAYTPPQALIYQNFASTPVEAVDPLRAHISGPHAYLLRYSEASEKVLGYLGEYDPDAPAAHAWPHRPAGGVVDVAYTKLFIDSALLEYFTDLIGADDEVALLAGTTDRIWIDDATYGFRSNGDDFPRFAALADRDVAVGDRVRVRGVVSAENVTLDTYVKALEADQTDAAVAAPVAAPGNGTTRSATSVVTQTAGVDNCNDLVVSLSSYSAWGDGYIDDTYTVTVIQGSVGGVLETALLRVTSASGRDDAASVAPAEIDSFRTVGARGLQLKFTCSGHSNASLSTDDLVPGQTWTVAAHDNYTALTATAAGTYTGAADAVYVVTCTRGGTFAATPKPQVTVTTTTGGDSGGPTTVTGTGVAVAVGTEGVTITLGAGPTGMRKGDRFTIAATAAGNGRFGTIVLGHDLPAGLQAASDLDLHLYIRKNLAVDARRLDSEPDTNWDQSATEITVNDGIVAGDPTLTDDGAPFTVPVAGGAVYVEYRAWRQELVEDVGGVSDVGLIDDAISGPLSPDNPLKWGVFKALSNANGTLVRFTAVADPDDAAAWTAALGQLIGLDDVYNLVPLTADRTVLDAFAAHVADRSTPAAAQWRAAVVSLTRTAERPVVSAATSSDGGLVLAKIADDPGTSGTQYTKVTVPAGNGLFLTNGVRAGDVVRYAYGTSWGEEHYETAVVDLVSSEDTLLLAAGASAAVSTASKIEVWHPLTKNEQAADVAAQAAAYGSSRVVAVWPDFVGSGGTTMPGYYLAAAIAGLTSGVAPHQGLTHVAIQGFDDVTRSNVYFNADQLNTMAAGGVWVVMKDRDGTIFTRHALTTDMSDFEHQAEMIRRNVDSLSYLFLHRIAPRIGKTNATPSANRVLYADLLSAIEYAKVNRYTDDLGAQLIEGSITSGPTVDPIFKNRLNVAMALDVPEAVDTIVVQLNIS